MIFLFVNALFNLFSKASSLLCTRLSGENRIPRPLVTQGGCGARQVIWFCFHIIVGLYHGKGGSKGIIVFGCSWFGSPVCKEIFKNFLPTKASFVFYSLPCPVFIIVGFLKRERDFPGRLDAPYGPHYTPISEASVTITSPQETLKWICHSCM